MHKTKVQVLVTMYAAKLGVVKRGEVLTLSDTMATDLINDGLAEAVKEPAKAQPKESETKRTPRKKTTT